MQPIFIYLIKVSVSLAVVFLFYKLLLEHLTFYTWNRWYLLVYTLLSFFIPFINITNVLKQNNWQDYKAIQAIPEVNNLPQVRSVTTALSLPAPYSASDLLLFIFIAGAIVMLTRFILQWISFLKIKRKARIFLKDTIILYDVSDNIVPFSFGSSVFIN